MPPIVTAVIALVLWYPLKAVLGGHFHYPFFAGLVAGYVWYDLTHYYLHHAAPTTAAGKWLRKYHLVHHFQTPDRRYGITTPLWDFVFQTYPRDRYQGLPDDEARIEAGA
jgi:dihydroceramide fatty acyl 2-hydroxylase